MFRRIASAALLLAAFVGLSSFASDTSLPRIVVHDNTHPAGALKNGVLTVHLEIRDGDWYPEAENGPHIRVDAFSEAGQEPTIPGPLIRVTEGIRIHAVVRNKLATPMAVHGLNQRPGKDEPVTLAPGEEHVFDFASGAPGTYLYWAGAPGRTMGGLSQRLDGDSSQLSGGFVVDRADKQNSDRVFVIGLWRMFRDLEHLKGLQEFAVINGKSWPYTERLSYRIGDEAHWRWINASGAIHPMHLHGAFYRVDAVGDSQQDNAYAPEMRPMVVTHLMQPGATMETTWVPATPGHWLFHCHLMAHLDPTNSLSALQGETASGGHEHAGMIGLVMRLEVEGLPKIKAAAYQRARKLSLVVEQQQANPLQVRLRLIDGDKMLESQALEGPPIVLRKGEPTEITVVNHLTEPTSIHWHGMELESYYDGVPNFTGMGKRMTPAIEPGGEFVARMTPPRAGTFIYHSHWHDIAQLEGGLDGPLLVVEPGQYDPQADQVFLASCGQKGSLLLNGAAQPAAIEWRAGQRYHVRLINIGPNLPVAFTLSSSVGNVSWKAVGKDGMELPAVQQAAGQATQLVAVGETYDFETAISSVGDLVLTGSFPAIPGITEGQTVTLPIHVR
ncbi:MAG: multicopper oxidase domain-containing protein [Terriglobales bacterium]